MKLKKSKLINIFIVNNQITAVVVLSIINNFKFRNDEVIIIFSRNCTIELLNKFQSIKHETNSKTLAYLSNLNKLAHLYTPWMFSLPELLVKNFNLDFSYIEEGTLSHLNFREYNWMPWLIRKHLLKGPSISWFYKSGANNYYCIHPYAFMKVKNRTILPVTDIGYRYQLKKNDSVVLMPPLHRFSDFSWIKCFDYLKTLNVESLKLKLHPSGGELSKTNSLIFQSYGIEVLDHNCILELEMLKSNLFLYGPPSSLQIYSELYGSVFVLIEFPNYFKSKRI